MTFDEFFKKKRIDLVALQKAEPALFAEFKNHFEQMGEKSFDHTKKYWFNKTRRQFPLAPEIKTEKSHVANPLAEQTITESLTEPASPAPSPKVGFTPKFRAATPPEPAAEEKKEELPTADEPIENAPAKPAGFVPRFKMKPKAETEETTPAASDTPPQAAETTAAKPAYKPRFVPPKPKAETEEDAPAVNETPPAPDNAEKKPAYKPRFVPPKPKE